MIDFECSMCGVTLGFAGRGDVPTPALCEECYYKLSKKKKKKK
jgi:hypothetical protein